MIRKNNIGSDEMMGSPGRDSAGPQKPGMGRRVSCCSGSTHAWFLRAGNHDPGHMIQVPDHMHRGVHRVKHLLPCLQETSGARGGGRWRPEAQPPRVQTTEVNSRLRRMWPKARARVLHNTERQPGEPELYEDSQKCRRNIPEAACESTSASQPSELQLRDMMGEFPFSLLH